MKKRVFSAILTLCLLLTMMPTVAFAADDDEVGQSNPVLDGNCGAADSGSSVRWELKQNNEGNENPTYTLTISGSGAMANYTANINNKKMPHNLGEQVKQVLKSKRLPKWLCPKMLILLVPSRLTA